MKQLVCENFEAFRNYQGKALPEGDWIVVTQEMINNFAKATMDFQWIHIDEARAKKDSPFKTTIAHGFMSVSLLSKMLEDLVVVKTATMGVNYGLNKVRFPSPVLVNDKLRLKANIGSIEDYNNGGLKITWNCIVEIHNKEKPACVADFISLMF